MFLKNASQTASIVIRTVKGKVGLLPQEVVNINVKLMTPIPPSLCKATEEEYLQCMEQKNSLINGIIIEQELQKQKIQLNEDEHVENNIQNEDKKDNINPQDDIKQPQEESNTKIPKLELNQTSGLEMVNELIQSNLLEGETVEQVIEIPKKDDVAEQKQEDKSPSLIVETMETGSDIDKLKQQIESLQQAWVSTRGAKKKEKLQKQIMELKKQLSKLEK